MRKPALDDLPLTRERMERLVRIYHSPRYAAEAINRLPNSVYRRAKQLGLKFRQFDGQFDDDGETA